MSISRWMDKKAVVHIYNGVLLSHQKEYIWISSNEVDETGADYTDWSKPERQTPIKYTNTYMEKAMAPYSSTLAWKIPWAEEPSRCPWSHEESDTTEQLHFHFSLSCIGEGNDNPLQCSCPENPRDGEPGGLLSMGSHRVGHDWRNSAAAAAAATHIYGI